MPLIHFLLVFDRRQQKLLRTEDFENASDAAARYAELEQEHRGDEIEIVLVGSDSLETVKKTHSNYFRKARSLEEFLARA